MWLLHIFSPLLIVKPVRDSIACVCNSITRAGAIVNKFNESDELHYSKCYRTESFIFIEMDLTILIPAL